MVKGNKILYLLIVLSNILVTNTIHAQNSEKYSISEQWFVGINIGTQYYISDFNFHRNASLGYGFSSNVEAYAGKWLTPFFALQGIVSHNSVSSGEIIEHEYPKDPQVVTGSFGLIHTEIDMLLDVRYLLNKEKKIYSFKPYMGIGYAFNTTDNTNGLSASLGGINSWMLNEHLGVQINAKVTFYEDKVDGFTDRDDVQLTLNAGFFYSF